MRTKSFQAARMNDGRTNESISIKLFLIVWKIYDALLLSVSVTHSHTPYTAHSTQAQSNGMETMETVYDIWMRQIVAGWMDEQVLYEFHARPMLKTTTFNGVPVLDRFRNLCIRISNQFAFSRAIVVENNFWWHSEWHAIVCRMQRLLLAKILFNHFRTSERNRNVFGTASNFIELFSTLKLNLFAERMAEEDCNRYQLCILYFTWHLSRVWHPTLNTMTLHRHWVWNKKNAIRRDSNNFAI